MHLAIFHTLLSALHFASLVNVKSGSRKVIPRNQNEHEKGTSILHENLSNSSQSDDIVLSVVWLSYTNFIKHFDKGIVGNCIIKMSNHFQIM